MINPERMQRARAAAVRWARDLLQTEFVIFDSETTGLGAQDEFVQLGVIDAQGAVLLDTLVRPTHPIDPGAARVHGLSAVHLIGERKFESVHPDLAAALSGRRVVVYNADFDRRILSQTCARYGLPGIEVADWECAMKRYAEFYGAWNGQRRSFRWHSLEAACRIEDLNVYDLTAHSAVDDCQITLRLLRKMAAAAE